MKCYYPLFIWLLLFGFISCKKSFITTQTQEKSILSGSVFMPPWYIPSWHKIPDNPRPRFGAFAFTINLKGYVGGGAGVYPTLSNSLKDLWEFDPELQSWTVRADLPALSREFAASFVIGSKAYLS